MNIQIIFYDSSGGKVMIKEYTEDEFRNMPNWTKCGEAIYHRKEDGNYYQYKDKVKTNVAI
jgi:hypothetical protein